MYEVAGASAYTPEAWTPPRRSRNDNHSQRSSSPTKSPSPRKPLLTSSAAPLPRPRIPPPQPTRYRNSASRSPDRNRRSAAGSVEYDLQRQRLGTMDSSDSRWSPMGSSHQQETGYRPSMHQHNESIDSQTPVAPYAAYHAHSPNTSPTRDNRFDRRSAYDDPYAGISPAPPRHFRDHSDLGPIDPHEIADDDEPLDNGRYDRGSAGYSHGPGAAGVTGAAAGGILGAFGKRDGSGAYGRAPNGADRFDGTEKATWRDMENRHRKSRKRTILIVLGIVLVLAVAGAVVGGVLGTKKSHEDSKTISSTSPSSTLDANSDQIKSLMNNPNLHRVFPAMDYTGVNMQYPDCLSDPPSQDNVTMDVAMMSQLTPNIRVYGTDCNQTEMVLTAIDRLNMNDTMHMWLGVWLGSNTTTNTRQLAQLYDIMEKYPSNHFKGVIVGNEVLFRKDLTLEQLGDTIKGVKQNLTNMKIDLPVATSDLGSDWTTELSSYSDLVLANVHPFFAGVTAEQAASWTWTFWENNDVKVTGAGTEDKNIISEVGWPSQGGNDCGTGNTCSSTTDGSVASIDNMNTFMDQWVCQAMTNGTQYFWFEAFDEPWKIAYDTGSDNWEDHWGLMTVDRQLKNGLKIPDCGGKTVS